MLCCKRSVKLLLQVAKLYGVPVILHTDHCQKAWLPWFDGLIEASEEYFEKYGEPLFSSHMLDLSEERLSYTNDPIQSVERQIASDFKTFQNKTTRSNFKLSNVTILLVILYFLTKFNALKGVNMFLSLQSVQGMQ